MKTQATIFLELMKPSFEAKNGRVIAMKNKSLRLKFLVCGWGFKRFVI